MSYILDSQTEKLLSDAVGLLQTVQDFLALPGDQEFNDLKEISARLQSKNDIKNGLTVTELFGDDADTVRNFLEWRLGFSNGWFPE